jgi:hypothetical protein
LAAAAKPTGGAKHVVITIPLPKQKMERKEKN